MPATEAPITHFLESLFAPMREQAEQPLLYEKKGNLYSAITRREVAGRIADFSRALHAAAMGPGDRMAFYVAAASSLLTNEWAVLACRGIVVIIPRGFSLESLIDTLVESRSRLVMVDELATAYHLANSSASLPDLRHIICLEGSAQTPIPISSLNEFLDLGSMEPDRSIASMRAIAGKDTALMFYYRDTAGKRQATRYTHTLVLEHIAHIDTLLGTAGIRKDELVLTATAWEHAIGHIASCYAPILKGAVAQITHGGPDLALFENHPGVTVGDGPFFDGLRESIERLVRDSGRVESAMLAKALSLGKIRYEKKGSARPLQRLQQAAVNATVVKKVRQALGDKLRLFIGTDNETRYETQLFFHTFGIDLIELPQEVFR